MNTSIRGESNLDRFLRNKTVDRVVGIVAVAPFAYALGEVVMQRPIQVENLLLTLELTVLAFTMLTRRAPVRVTHNPLFWLLALVATYWTFITPWFYDPGRRIAPEGVTLTVAVVGALVAIWGRVSLGRNIGFVPAERQIVTTGAYAFVRHPIYTGLFINILAVNLSNFSVTNVALDTVWLGLWVAKTLVEESFLRQSAEYAAYVRQVRWRWAPWIA